MQKFTITVKYTIKMSGSQEVEVEAENAEDAEDKAMELISDSDLLDGATIEDVDFYV